MMNKQEQEHQEEGQNETFRDSRVNQLQYCRQRIALFKGLQADSFNDRMTALEKIIQVVKSYIRSSRSPISPPTTSPTTAISPLNVIQSPQLLDQCTVDNEDDYGVQLFYYLITIVRLAYTCPYSDVRKTFKDFLKLLKDSSVPIPRRRFNSPSHFISLNDIFSLESYSSSYQLINYPRNCTLSFSPWSTHLEDEKLFSQQQELQYEEDSQSQATADPSMPISDTDNDDVDPRHFMYKDFTGGRPSDEYVRQMTIRNFIDEGRLGNIFRILSFFPTFLEIYHATFHKIMKTPMGPLHRTWKSYIGIMVAAEQKCQYLVSIMKLDFLHNGGDPKWLKGLEYAPLKLRNIQTFIMKLARQPWRLRGEDIDNLGLGMLMGDTWTRGELVQAVLIISTLLGLSSFTMGCGIAPEIDMTGGFDINNENEIHKGIEYELDFSSSPIVFHSTDREAVNAADSATGWQHMDEYSFTSDQGKGLGVHMNSTEEVSDKAPKINDVTTELITRLKSKKSSLLKDQLVETMENRKDQENKPISVITDLFPYSDKDNRVHSEEINAVYEDLKVFINIQLDRSIHLEEFEESHRDYHEFMLGEYCWEDHGSDLVNHFLPGIGDDLVSEFIEAISITDWSIFHPIAEEVIDTSPLRNAIWYHTQKIMGVIKEDYNYDDIATYLNDRTTQYIHKLCMSPHTIQKNDWLDIGISLRPEEKCHVNLLVASARKQAVLCYGLSLLQ
ncbi:PA26 p53-induced protein-domain-containing protein [Pilobolus umbonatus]|nr:PA26 p53-induced protein-domain-containing protein [Pilobolus umbonatus]